MEASIYTLLEKHFQNQTTEDEESLVTEFKESNHQEYHTLKNLWQSNADIKVVDFDSEKAWKTITRASKPKITYSFKRVAAIAILLIVGSLFALFISQRNTQPIFVEVTAPAIGTDSVLLADGSTVWLNKNSKLIYPQKFRGKTREVELIGEAYFEVAKNPDKPFEVQTSNSTITVLGTSFNINTKSDSTDISVRTGKVNVLAKLAQQSVVLTPNQMAVVSNSGLTKSVITNPNYLSWKTGLFTFEETPLDVVIRDLNRYYSKPISLKTNKEDLLFTAQFDQTLQEDILEILKITFNLNVHENANSFEID